MSDMQHNIPQHFEIVLCVSDVGVFSCSICYCCRDRYSWRHRLAKVFRHRKEYVFQIIVTKIFGFFSFQAFN